MLIIKVQVEHFYNFYDIKKIFKSVCKPKVYNNYIFYIIKILYTCLCLMILLRRFIEIFVKNLPFFTKKKTYISPFSKSDQELCKQGWIRPNHYLRRIEALINLNSILFCNLLNLL